MQAVQLTRTHRILVAVVVIGAVTIAAIGFAGSFAAVRDLAEKKGFGAFAPFFPIGIDAGIVVLLALDLLLTWIRIPFPLLRQTAWLLTAATIAFNGAAAWPDALGVGMHAVIPVLFVVSVEAARHAIGRIADITADRHMEGVRVSRWLLAFPSTFRLWRRMKLWELRSYDEVIRMEQDRLVYEARLQARFGRSWRRKAPVESLMPLKLARYGVPLSETGPQGLAAAGIDAPAVASRPAAASRGAGAVRERAEQDRPRPELTAGAAGSPAGEAEPSAAVQHEQAAGERPFAAATDGAGEAAAEPAPQAPSRRPPAHEAGDPAPGPVPEPAPAAAHEPQEQAPAYSYAEAQPPNPQVTVPVGPGRRRALGNSNAPVNGGPAYLPPQRAEEQQLFVEPRPAPPSQQQALAAEQAQQEFDYDYDLPPERQLREQAPAAPASGSLPEDTEPVGIPDGVPRDEFYFNAYRQFVASQASFPNARQLSRALHERHGVTNADGSLLSESYLRSYMREFRERYNTEMGLAG
ncbi:Protein of unknown function [Streptomyces sp. WMMB 714]|uniref:DUF2637 domain-containing protein n=1 Tax=Streptomyces sp. WMMB 714 TaxID=1286822 RepID=UPI000823F516|nr:DUF2637 domain-containing protein [Streptomyces sp. WMMB 714]SCK55738.1 Protein of unknown function [Streptomyces sp. WMMB 714]